VALLEDVVGAAVHAKVPIDGATAGAATPAHSTRASSLLEALIFHSTSILAVFGSGSSSAPCKNLLRIHSSCQFRVVRTAELRSICRREGYRKDHVWSYRSGNGLLENIAASSLPPSILTFWSSDHPSSSQAISQL